MKTLTTNSYPKTSNWLQIFAILLLTTTGLSGPDSVMAEESVLITLHEEIGRGVEEMKLGFKQLATETPAAVEAKTWAKRARDLPTDTPGFAQAQAQYVAARSQDLEYRAMVVKQTYNATTGLTTLIDRLITVQSKSFSGNDSAFGGETEEMIRKKVAEFQGIDRLMGALIRGGNVNPKVKSAQQAFQVKMKTAIRKANMKTATGIEKLTSLRDTTEGLSYLMRAYADGLDLQQYSLTYIAIHGEAGILFQDASTVIEEALSMLDAENIGSVDDDFFMDSVDASGSSLFGDREYSRSMGDSIGAAAENLISRQD